MKFCENIQNIHLVLTSKRYDLFIGTILFQLVIKTRRFLGSILLLPICLKLYTET